MNSKILKRSILLVMSILLILYIFRFSTIFDEDYSLVLIHNTFSNIIKYDSIDVHPPLFYFLLKSFLYLTTFWTNSFLIKLLFARFFIVIVTLVTFFYLLKIIYILNINRSKYEEFILFLIVPGVISLTYAFIKIRMYSLGALFIVIEFYKLTCYHNFPKRHELIESTIMAILAIYTNYYVAIIAVLLLLLNMIILFIKHNKSWIYFLGSIVLSLASFLPWLPIFIKQLSYQKYHSLGGMSIFWKQWVATCVLILIFMYPMYWSKRNLNECIYREYKNSFIILITLFIVMTLISFIDQPVFQFRYFYPIFIVYGFLGINTLIFMCKRKNIFSLLLICILSLSCMGAYVSQMNYYGKYSIQILKEFHAWKDDKSKCIYLKSLNNSDQNFDVEKIMYLSRIHKNVRVKNENNVKWMTDKTNKGLFNKINNHMYH